MGEHLVVVIGIDRPHSLTMVSASTLADWGRTFDECLELAVDNLGKAEPIRFEAHDLGFHFAVCDDRNPAARLLTPEVFAALPLRGEPVVVAAARMAVVVAGSEDAGALAGIATFVPGYLRDETRPLSYAPMVFRDGQWRDFEASPLHPAIADLHTLQRLFDYDDQRPLKQNWLDEEERPEDVAGLTVLTIDGALRSILLWETPQSVLPRADFVVRRLPHRGCVVRAWADVDRAFGGLKPEPPPYAPYYTAADPLDPEALLRLEAAPEPEFARGKGFGMVHGRLTVMG